MKLRTGIALIFSAFVFITCSETADIYLGIPLQPKIDENNFEPGLNIIGSIRPDFSDTINKSFVHVQEVAPAINNYPEFTIDSLIIRDANVLITDNNNNEYEFSYTQYDSLFNERQYRPKTNFVPEPGMLYKINCTYNDLPVLSSSTIVPKKPVLLENTFLMSGNNLYFEIEADTTSFMYEIYVYNNKQNTGYARVVSSFTENTPVEIILSENNAKTIEIYAYDYNLASYYITSNTSLNFNKYRKTFGNVENGYGVFGSLNFIIYNME
jgi:hypothetical protein